MVTAAARPSWAKRMLAWPKFLLRRDADPGHLYDLRGVGAIETGGSVPVVNMGLWDGIAPHEPEALERACFALFDLVARGAGVHAGDEQVLDAGCGFGTNAAHVAGTFGPGRVTGVNVSAVQLATARAHVEATGLDERVEFLLADVTRLPLPEASIDVVLSVEAAFHFDTRDDFFAEAFRVLKPGGRLSMVDLVIPPARNVLERMALAMICRSQAVPSANVYDLAEWTRRLRAAGFEVEVEESIIHRVFPHFRRWMLTRPLGLLLRYDFMFLVASSPYLVYPLDYVRVVARKP